ncbi:MAG: RIP metalloprotease RseP [Myxococcales bacterium]|nr:RIP metalloprotease RseP [Myxococcales bacterium]
MQVLQTLASFVVFLGVLIFVHELGHFLVAKLMGVKILRFSIGFGPRIFGVTRGETEYRVSWVPLGGYVKMAGEQPFDELPPEEARRGFLAQPPWKRGLIVLAGPAFNLLFAIPAFFFVFWGTSQEISTRIGSVEPDLPAARAGLRPGDRILAVEGEPVQTFDELRAELRDAYDKEISLTVKRGESSFVARLVPTRRVESDPIQRVTRGMIGISPDPRPAVVGVPAGSAAERAGLRTFDRVLSVNGKPVSDELALSELLAAESGTLALQVARRDVQGLPGAAVQVPSIVPVSIEKGAGEGFEALGVERADPYISHVVPGSPAAAAGIKSGDRLATLNGKPVGSWDIFQSALREIGDRKFSLEWVSAGVRQKSELSQVKVEVSDELGQKLEELDLGVRSRPGFAEASRREMVTVQLGASQALVASVKKVPEVIVMVAIIIAKLFTRDVPFENVGGPIMVAQIAGRSAELGVKAFLGNMAFLSINLGLLNLLPIPILDGFHLLAAVWEGVRKRPIPLRAREIANMVGLALLAVLMVMVIRNDITRLLR